MRPKVLVAEDDQVQRDVIADILERAEYDATRVSCAEEALSVLRAEDVDLLVTDMRMPGMDGLELLREAKRLRPGVEVVVMTAHASIETAVAAMKEGAADYLTKPFDKEELLVVVAKATERARLLRENRELRELVTHGASLGNIVGQSPAMQRVFELTQKAVSVNSTVLIQGESGTGKELIARHIHFEGPRKDKPFVVVNCAAIPDTLVESELFGHEKGSFTGAETSRKGKFEIAHGGTVFLDEIGDMHTNSQAKLLRVLQDGIVERVGSSQPRKVDVRVIAATNRNLGGLVANGEFREDLFFRLDVLPIRIPPLRERIQDLPILVAHFRAKISARLDRSAPRIGADVLEAMRRYRWPGNVRELENTLEQLFIMCDSDALGAGDLPEKLLEFTPQSGQFTLPLGGIVLEDLEQDLIRQALERSGGRIKEAAELLGLTYKTLQYRLKKHDIDRRELVQ
ncbi:MAG TPA: sigma-54-dependent Fis family transcriptional regulator [Candidatus Hydrogenedentes bacterium]|nr:sigma-54-dependent Fis family transcriptional regulator [Candidatus Hydrogenedentota bacterium]